MLSREVGRGCGRPLLPLLLLAEVASGGGAGSPGTTLACEFPVPSAVSGCLLQVERRAVGVSHGVTLPMTLVFNASNAHEALAPSRRQPHPRAVLQALAPTAQPSQQASVPAALLEDHPGTGDSDFVNDGDETSSTGGRRGMRRGSGGASGGDHDVSGGGGHSVFHIRFEDLDSGPFWCILMLMLALTIIVDRTEYFATYHARNSKAERMFIERFRAELTMFGCVGLTIFCVSNVWSEMNEKYSLMVEFVDILCSLGACGVIAVAGILFGSRGINGRRWEAKQRVGAGLRGVSTPGSGRGSPGAVQRAEDEVVSLVGTFGGLGPAEFHVMAQQFGRRHGLPDEFQYADYLKECYVRNACDLMDILWTTWLLMLALAGFLFLTTQFSASKPTIETCVIFLTVTHWLLFVGYLAILMRVSRARGELLKHLREVDATQEQAGRSSTNSTMSNSSFGFSQSLESQTPMPHDFGGSVRWCVQILTLLNSFLLAFYIMHLEFNLQEKGYEWYWRPLLVAPIALGLGLLLPVLMDWFTVLEAYYEPDHDALDDLLEQIDNHDNDLHFLRKMWNLKGNPKLSFPQAEKGLDEEGFGRVVRRLGFPVSKMRLQRLFVQLDEDGNGRVDPGEFLSKLEQQGTMSLHGAKLQGSPAPLRHLG